MLRAGVMGALGGLAMLSGRAGVSLNALCAAVTGLVLVRPDLATDMGFVLSVLATAGIVVSARPVTRVLSARLPTVLAVCIAVPLVAQLWCGPLALSCSTPTCRCTPCPPTWPSRPGFPVVTVAGLLMMCVLLTEGTCSTPCCLGLCPVRRTPPRSRAGTAPRACPWASRPTRHVPSAGSPTPSPPCPARTSLATRGLRDSSSPHAPDRPRARRPAHGGRPHAPAAAHHRHRGPHPRRAPGSRRRVARPCAPHPGTTPPARRHRLPRPRRAPGHRGAVVVPPAPAVGIRGVRRGAGDAVLHRTGEHSTVLVDGGPDPGH